MRVKKLMTRRGQKVWAICVALLIALMLAGVSYGMWLDTITIDLTSETGTISTEMTSGNTSNATALCWSGSVATGDSPFLTLTFNGADAGDYSAGFALRNTGTLPFKISSVSPSTTLPGLPPGSSVAITGIGAGSQIEPGISKAGMVGIHLTDSYSDGFSVGVTVVLWTQYP